MTIEELAYTAGLVDGEGSVAICYDRKQPEYSLQVTVTNTHRETLEWLAEEYGGLVYAKKRYLPRRQCYEWRIGAKRAMLFLEDIAPWMRIKTAQVALARKFRGTYGPKTLTPEVWEIREACYTQMHALNIGV